MGGGEVGLDLLRDRAGLLRPGAAGQREGEEDGGQGEERHRSLTVAARRLRTVAARMLRTVAARKIRTVAARMRRAPD